MKTRRLVRALGVFVTFASGALLACGKSPKPQGKSQPGSVASVKAEARDRLAEFRAATKRASLEKIKKIDEQATTLLRAAEANDTAQSREAYRALRRTERELSPFVRALAPLSSAGLGGYGTEQEDGAEGFRPLHAALAEEPPQFAKVIAQAKIAQRAITSLRAEVDLAAFTPAQVGYALSDGAFVFGARADGSDAPDEATRIDDLRAEGGSLLLAITGVRDAVRATNPVTADALDDDALVLSAFLQTLPTTVDHRTGDAPTPRGLLALIRATGEIGQHLRAAFAATAEAKIPAPFVGAHGETAISVGTMPRMRRPADPTLIELGKQLFHSTAFSANGKLACATCHVSTEGFARRGARPIGALGTKTPREPLSLWNVGYEVAFFWDGRAGSLEDQLDGVLARDLSTSWPEVMTRLGANPELWGAITAVTHAEPTTASVKAALVAYERSLVAADLPIDAYFHGKTDALTDEAARGFDLYFGKARCSRCHRLPLTSGVFAPRFLETELSAIGVPTQRGSKRRDPDAGRGAVTKAPEDEAMFRVPTLRHSGETAPYFHNGSFATLEEVVAFYEQGAGLSVDKQTPNLDPELRPFTLTDTERKALLSFLREGLGGSPSATDSPSAKASPSASTRP
jgi:cytochrome c peroxidase